MKVQINRRGAYDYIIINGAEFMETENGIIDMDETEYLETGDDKTLRTGGGMAVYAVEDYSAIQIIAIANGVKICSECHKLENTPHNTPDLCDHCQCSSGNEPKPEFMSEWENPSHIVAWGVQFGKHLIASQRNAHRDKYASKLGHIPIYAIDGNVYLTDRGLYQGQPISTLDPNIHLTPIE